LVTQRAPQAGPRRVRVRLLPRAPVRVRLLPFSIDGAWWPLITPLALMLSSDYKLRSRANDQAVSGHPDVTVFFEIAVYGAVALFLYWRFGFRAPRRRGSPLLIMAWAFAGYLALSTVWSPYPQLGVVRGIQLLITASLGYVLATRCTPADLHRFAHAFVVVVLASVAVGVLHPFPRDHLVLNRFNWFYLSPVEVGVYLAFAILVVVGFLLRTREGRLWPRPVYVAALVILVTALVATGTRGAAIGCISGLLVLLATVRGPRGRIDLLVVGVVLTVIVVLGFSNEILAFAARGEDSQQLLTLNSRANLWALAFQAFQQDPIFGHGLGASRGLFLATIGLGGGHNAFVNALVDNGVLGTAIFVTLLLMVGMALLRLVRLHRMRTDPGLLLAILTFAIVDGLTYEGLAAPANASSVWLFVLIAWTETLRRQEARKLPAWNLSASTAPTSPPLRYTTTTGGRSTNGSAPTG
jgi:exopolysaccharide production protein ExoQ